MITWRWVFAASMLASSAWAQPASLPEYIGNFAIQTPTGLLSLEREQSKPRADINMAAMIFSVGKSKGYVYIDGEKSPVRIHFGAPISFILRVASQDKDPQGYVQFWRVTSANGKRELLVATASNFSGQETRHESESAIAFTASKFGKDYVKVIPAQSLTPGEYWISTNDQVYAWAFGVDQ